MSTSDNTALLESTLADAVNLAPSVIIEAALFGLLTLLVAFSIITIVRQGITTRSRVFMVVAMGVMYIASGIHWSLNVYTFMREIRDPAGWAALPVPVKYRWSVITTVALFFNFWISDIIVMWRAVLVWEWDRRITVPCSIFIVLPFIFAVVDVATSHGTQDMQSFRPNIYGYVALGISLFSNVFATVFVGIKAWSHRSNIRRYLDNATTPTVSSVLILLVESGSLYCAVWALFIVSTVLNKGSFKHAAHAISGVVPQLVGLYPAIIILLVALQKTHCDRNFTYEGELGGSVRFASSSRRTGGTTRSATQLEEGHGRGMIATHQSRRSILVTRGSSGSKSPDNDTMNLSSLNENKHHADDTESAFGVDDKVNPASLSEYDTGPVHAL